MQRRIIISSVLVALSLGACSRSKSANDADRDRQTPAEAVGKMIYKANKEAEKAAAAAARELRKSAVEAHKGYKEAQQQDREKAKAKDQKEQ